jgi:thioredoxin 1
MYEIITLNDFNKILTNNLAVVVDFYADWCGPCKQIAPYYEQLSIQYPDIFFCKVNIEKGDEIASLCEISSLPTFLFYKNKKNIDEVIGTNKIEIQEKIKKL